MKLPPAVAREFVDDMRALFTETDGHKRDAIGSLFASFTHSNASKVPREAVAPVQRP